MAVSGGQKVAKKGERRIDPSTGKKDAEGVGIRMEVVGMPDSKNEFDFSFTDHGLDLPWLVLPELETQMQMSNVDSISDSMGAVTSQTLHTNAESSLLFDFDLEKYLLSSLDTPSVEIPTALLPFGPRTEELDSFEQVSLMFHKQIGHFLSVYEEPDQNSWTTLIWPMVKESKSVFHAIAAMTFLHASKSDADTDPSMREKGLEHVDKSTQALGFEMKNGETNVENILASTVSLAFAFMWETERSSITGGAEQIHTALERFEEAFSNNLPTYTTIANSPTLRFLANAWIYTDVFTRLTTPHSQPKPPQNPQKSKLRTLFTTLPSSPSLDPLTGYTTTLLPIINRVADLITHILTTPHNSPTTISTAHTLRTALTTWHPPLSLEDHPSPTPLMTDAIQTAEAYRWAALLYIQQAVPELPNLSSLGELGRKVLIYLATVGVGSSVLKAHVWPLLVAGVEAVGEEDRAFVRGRWGELAEGMSRCVDVTEEVWRRRDAYLVEIEKGRGSRSRGGSASPDTGACILGALVARKPSLRSEFPISAAFKKKVDWLTRSGYMEYTVRGKLHFLGVMKDWGWDGLEVTATF